MNRKMQSPLKIIGVGAGSWGGAVRLPPGERIQLVHFSAGNIRYRYGNTTSPALYVAATGLSPILMHPGTEVFIELSQAAGTDCYIHVVGGIPDNENENSWGK